MNKFTSFWRSLSLPIKVSETRGHCSMLIFTPSHRKVKMSKIPPCPNCSLHELVCICIHKKLQGWSVDITLFRQITQWSMDCWLMWPQATTEMCRFNFSPSLVSQICTLWRVKVAELLLFPVHADTLRHTAHSLATIVIQMKPCCQCFPCRPEATGQPDMTSSSVLTSWRAEMLWIQLFF